MTDIRFRLDEDLLPHLDKVRDELQQHAVVKALGVRVSRNAAVKWLVQEELESRSRPAVQVETLRQGVAVKAPWGGASGSTMLMPEHAFDDLRETWRQPLVEWCKPSTTDETLDRGEVPLVVEGELTTEVLPGVYVTGDLSEADKAAMRRALEQPPCPQLGVEVEDTEDGSIGVFRDPRTEVSKALRDMTPNQVEVFAHALKEMRDVEVALREAWMTTPEPGDGVLPVTERRVDAQKPDEEDEDEPTDDEPSAVVYDRWPSFEYYDVDAWEFPESQQEMHDYYTKAGWVRVAAGMEGRLLEFYWTPNGAEQGLPCWPGRDNYKRGVVPQSSPDLGTAHMVPDDWDEPRDATVEVVFGGV